MLSAGEMRMTDKLSEGNLRARAGQQVRLIDIPADAGMGFGVSSAGADGDAKVLADNLKAAARTSYGTAGPEFVRRLIANGIDKSTATIEATIKTFQKRYAPPSADGQVLRVCDHFALVAAAGELARELGIVHWKSGTAIEAAHQCFRDWFENRGGAEAGEVQAAISQVRLLSNAMGIPGLSQ